MRTRTLALAILSLTAAACQGHKHGSWGGSSSGSSGSSGSGSSHWGGSSGSSSSSSSSSGSRGRSSSNDSGSSSSSWSGSHRSDSNGSSRSSPALSAAAKSQADARSGSSGNGSGASSSGARPSATSVGDPGSGRTSAPRVASSNDRSSSFGASLTPAQGPSAANTTHPQGPDAHPEPRHHHHHGWRDLAGESAEAIARGSNELISIFDFVARLSLDAIFNAPVVIYGEPAASDPGTSADPEEVPAPDEDPLDTRAPAASAKSHSVFLDDDDADELVTPAPDPEQSPDDVEVHTGLHRSPRQTPAR
ncbi:MAG: hypothetical protein JST92_18185 [Deltaproteobacteria bacterium]|nr:hypothetical protein [Deltaproteobacteria bacterium]